MKYKKQVGAVLVGSLVLFGSASAYQLYPREGGTKAVIGANTEAIEEEVAVESTPEPVEKPVESGAAVTLIVEPAETLPTEPTPQTTQANPHGSNNALAYAYQRRLDSGKTVGMWGNMTSWHKAAAAAGVAVDSTPQVNDTVLVQIGGTTVVFIGAVDSVKGNTFTYTKMDSSGVTSTSTATLTGTPFSYLFIH